MYSVVLEVLVLLPSLPPTAIISIPSMLANPADPLRVAAFAAENVRPSGNVPSTAGAHAAVKRGLSGAPASCSAGAPPSTPASSNKAAGQRRQALGDISNRKVRGGADGPTDLKGSQAWATPFSKQGPSGVVPSMGLQSLADATLSSAAPPATASASVALTAAHVSQERHSLPPIEAFPPRSEPAASPLFDDSGIDIDQALAHLLSECAPSALALRSTPVTGRPRPVFTELPEGVVLEKASALPHASTATGTAATLASPAEVTLSMTSAAPVEMPEFELDLSAPVGASDDEHGREDTDRLLVEAQAVAWAAEPEGAAPSAQSQVADVGADADSDPVASPAEGGLSQRLRALDLAELLQ